MPHGKLSEPMRGIRGENPRFQEFHCGTVLPPCATRTGATLRPGDQRVEVPFSERTGMSLRRCDRGSSPLARLEFSAHCWFCGADRTGMSWTPTGTTPAREPRLALAGRPTQGL